MASRELKLAFFELHCGSRLIGGKAIATSDPIKLSESDTPITLPMKTKHYDLFQDEIADYGHFKR